MQPEAVLTMMKGYFEGKQPADLLQAFASVQPRTLLKESLDVVDFVVYLEEELGRDIDLNVLGEALLNKNFGDLAVEVSNALEEEG